MFKRISAHNLFSWADLDYEIKPGVSQITGFNYDDNSPEGCGKSSVPNILCWVLYGKVPKDAKIDEVIREGCRGGQGHVVLESGISVHRHRGPNDLYIGKPSEAPDTEYVIVKGKDAKETQTMINALVGLDFDAFCQTVYFAQNYPKKFVSATDTEKVSILSQVLDLTVFDKARDKAQNLARDTKSEVSGIEQKKTEVSYMLTKLRSNAELLVRFVEKFEEEKAAKVSALEAGIASLEDQIEGQGELQGRLDQLTKNGEKVDSRLSQLQKDLVAIETGARLADSAVRTKVRLEKDAELCQARIAKIEAKLSKFNLSDLSCPTCGEPVSKHKVDHVFSEKQDLEEDLRGELAQLEHYRLQLTNLPAPIAAEDSREQLVAAQKEVTELTTKKKAIWDEASRCKVSLNAVASAKKEISKLKDALAKVDASQCDEELSRLSDLDRSVTEYEAAEKALERKLSEAKTKLSNLEILKTGFKEVKQFVFQALLNELSVKSTRLATELFEVPISIVFSNEDEEGGVSKISTTVTLDGHERSLGLYSGGQHRRIELAVDLALASIVAHRSQNPIKFRILDEPFKDLSEASMEKVVKLLEKLDGPTVVIEHNTITKSIIQNVFEIEYRSGVSHAS